jgi:hypothetical protein
LSVVSVVVRSCLGVCVLGHHYCLLVCVDVRVCLLACGCCFWRGQQRAAAEAAERKRVADEQVLGALQSLCVVAGINAGERERKWVWVCGCGCVGGSTRVRPCCSHCVYLFDGRGHGHGHG